MFKPFTRLANASGKPGSGLGLTVVRRLVNGMGGTINARPRQGGGLIVTLALVRSDAPSGALVRRTQPAAPIPTSPQNSETDSPPPDRMLAGSPPGHLPG